MENKRIIIAGIGTEVGKTLVSSIFCARLNSSYFKPLLSGSQEQSDSKWISEILPNTRIIPEIYIFKKPVSIHQASLEEKKKINFFKLQLPNLSPLIIETAGGILSPISNQKTNIDLLKKWKLPVVLVSQYYLGSINHTLLTYDRLKKEKIKILGIVFNGRKNDYSKKFILENTKLPCLLEIPQLKKIDSAVIRKLAKRLIIP